jgi:hypothetical protein
LIEAAAQAANLGLDSFEQDTVGGATGKLGPQGIGEEAAIKTSASHMADGRHEAPAIFLEVGDPLAEPLGFQGRWAIWHGEFLFAIEPREPGQGRATCGPAPLRRDPDHQVVVQLVI